MQNYGRIEIEGEKQNLEEQRVDITWKDFETYSQYDFDETAG
ncbi:MAG: hypothetical protein ACLTUL_03120 [Blautia faecis]